MGCKASGSLLEKYLMVSLIPRASKKRKGPVSRWGNKAVCEVEKPREALSRARYVTVRVSKCKERAGTVSSRLFHYFIT